MLEGEQVEPNSKSDSLPVSTVPPSPGFDSAGSTPPCVLKDDGTVVAVQSEPQPTLAQMHQGFSSSSNDDLDEINFSFRVAPHWTRLPHFRYRRLMHHFFENFHVYHPAFLPRGSTFAAGMNLAAATIGVGTLSMPYAAYSCGWGLFLVLMIITLVLSLWSIFALCRLVDITQFHSFEMMVRTILKSHKLEIVVEILIIFSCFGSAISYVVVIGDIAQSIASAYHPSWSSSVVRLIAQIAIFFVFLQPLSLLRTMGALKYASSVGVCAITILVIFILGEGITFGDFSNVQPRVAGSIRSILGGIPLLFFAVNNQINAIEIYSEMKGRTPSQFFTISCIAVGTIAVAFIFVGTCGFSLFGSQVEGNVLKNFSASNPIAMVAILGVGMKVVLSFPLLMFPCREAVLHFAGVEDVRAAPAKQFIGTTVGIAASTLVVAVFVPGVTSMFGLIGSICAAMFGFILPGMLAIREERFWVGLSDDQAKLYRGFSWVLVVVGVLVAISGTIISVMNIAQ